jgi:hypothetical protein
VKSSSIRQPKAAGQFSNACPSKGLISPKPNSRNGEEVKRTRPSPAFRFLSFSPRRLCSHTTEAENSCLSSFVHLSVLTERVSRMQAFSSMNAPTIHSYRFVAPPADQDCGSIIGWAIWKDERRLSSLRHTCPLLHSSLRKRLLSLAQDVLWG